MRLRAPDQYGAYNLDLIYRPDCPEFQKLASAFLEVSEDSDIPVDLDDNIRQLNGWLANKLNEVLETDTFQEGDRTLRIKTKHLDGRMHRDIDVLDRGKYCRVKVGLMPYSFSRGGETIEGISLKLLGVHQVEAPTN